MAVLTGIARAFIKSPTPPTLEEHKSLLWLHQTDVIGNPNLVIIKYWNQEANSGAGNWLALSPDQRVFVRETLAVASNGQTIFTLAQNVVNPHLTNVQVTDLPVQIYLKDFKITKDGITYDTATITNNRLDFLGNEYTLEVGESVYVIYQIA